MVACSSMRGSRARNCLWSWSTAGLGRGRVDALTGDLPTGTVPQTGAVVSTTTTPAQREGDTGRTATVARDRPRSDWRGAISLARGRPPSTETFSARLSAARGWSSHVAVRLTGATALRGVGGLRGTVLL